MVENLISSTDEDKQVNFTVRESIVRHGPPKGLNELSRIVGRRKRFLSRDFKNSIKEDNPPLKRLITI